MSESDIECPKCGHKILIDEVLKRRLNDQVNSEVSKRLSLEKSKLEDELKNKYESEQSEELKIAKEKLKFEAEKRAEAQKRELEFLKKQNELEDKLKSQEVEVARRILEEKKNIEEKLQKEIEEKKNFEVLELRKQLDDTKKSLQEAQRKAAQGSTQTQGEVLELTLEDALQKKFPHDTIEPVAKGINGADIIQKVISTNGATAGVMAWELKQTKAWVEDWITKLKDDGQRVKANLLILVSNVLPKEIHHFGQYKNVWVCDYASALGLASALRNNLISLHTLALSNENSQDKAAVLYKHLTSANFANRVRTLAETFISMKGALDKEKIAMQKIWSMRETHIDRLSTNTSQLFGEIQGIAGGQIEELEIMTLDAITEGDEPKIKEKKTKNIDDDKQANLF